jgi:FtsH-binding integral membrane protein
LKIRPAVHVAALCLQALIMVRNPIAGSRPLVRFNSLFVGTLASGLSRSVLAPVIGKGYLTDSSGAALVTTLLIALILCVVVVTVSVLLWRNSERIWRLFGMMYMGTVSLLMIMSSRRLATWFLSMDGIEHTPSERYFFISACMFVLCVTIIIDGYAERLQSGFKAALLLGLFALGMTRNFAGPPFVDFHWQNSISSIEKWEAAHKRHETTAPVTFPINPPGWRVELKDGL